MPITNDDNPLAGFELVTHPNGTFLHCRARGCFYSNHLVKVIKLEWLLYHAAKHRSECRRHIQHAPTLPILPFRIITEEVAADIATTLRAVKIDSDGTPRVIDIVAYTLASFWYCVEHGVKVRGAHAREAEDLLPQFHYHCDTCGKLIRKALLKDDTDG